MKIKRYRVKFYVETYNSFLEGYMIKDIITKAVNESPVSIIDSVYGTIEQTNDAY